MPLQSCVAAGAVCAKPSVAPPNATAAIASLGAQTFMMFSGTIYAVTAFCRGSPIAVIGEMMIRRKTDADIDVGVARHGVPTLGRGAYQGAWRSCRNMGPLRRFAPTTA